MASYENPAATGLAPTIIFYTNHGCPYAHRAAIALKELQLPCKEVIIDLEKPREQWYLDINPRGLVPAIRYSNGVIDEIITESAIVAQFLADERPSHLLPASKSSPTAALFRARVAFFVDTWNAKVSSYMFAAMKCATDEEREAKCQEWADAVKKDIEPLLADANPFFGGSEQMTMAEVQVAPFLIRAYAMSDGEILPTSLKNSLNSLPYFSKWAAQVNKQESVTYVFDEEKIRQGTKKRIAKMKAQAQ